MELIWTEQAVRDLAELREYIDLMLPVEDPVFAKENPDFGRRFAAARVHDLEEALRSESFGRPLAAGGRDDLREVMVGVARCALRIDGEGVTLLAFGLLRI